MKYIQVVGNPGSGKSTFSKKLARQLKLGYVELDAINWQPNWEMKPDEEFQKDVMQALDQYSHGWVVDGSYSKRAGQVIQSQIDTYVYLNIPLWISVGRVVRRSFRRIVKYEEVWPGVYESPVNATKLLYWLIKGSRNRIRRRRATMESLEEKGIHCIEFKSNKRANEWISHDA